MRRRVLLVAICLAVMLLSGCNISTEVPIKGVWYCEELNLAIEFMPELPGVKSGRWYYTTDYYFDVSAHFGYGNEISFYYINEEGREISVYNGYYYWHKSDQFMVWVHHRINMDDPYGAMIETDNEKYVFKQIGSMENLSNPT